MLGGTRRRSASVALLPMASIVPDDRGVLRGFSRTCHNRRLRRFLRARTAAQAAADEEVVVLGGALWRSPQANSRSWVTLLLSSRSP